MRIGQTGEKKATQEKRHKTDKEKEDSTDTAAKRQVAQDQSKVKRQRTEKRRGMQQKETSKKAELEVQVRLSRLWTDTPVQILSSNHNTGKVRPQCTCHVYGQMHQWPNRPP